MRIIVTLLVLPLFFVGSVKSAELLVKAKSHWMKAIDTIGQDTAWMAEYHRSIDKGQVVCIMPDGHKWGKKERPPTFIVIKIPGIPPDQLQTYTMPDHDITAFNKSTGIAPVYRLRIWTLGILTDSLLAVCDLSGGVIMPLNKIGNRMKKLKRPILKGINP